MSTYRNPLIHGSGVMDSILNTFTYSKYPNEHHFLYYNNIITFVIPSIGEFVIKMGFILYITYKNLFYNHTLCPTHLKYMLVVPVQVHI